MAVRMRKVLQTAGLVFECVTCFFRVSQKLGPVYMVSGTRDNPPPRDNFTERLYGVASCNSCPL